MVETIYKIGDLIENRYKVLDVIGIGGMGALYQVSDEVREGEVLGLKTMRLNLAEAEKQTGLERFQREFKLLIQMRHPNLVSVYDFGSLSEGDLYFTMEWVQGRALDPSSRSLEPVATIPVVVQICRALSYLHSRGVIHGDLKPGNVLLIGEQVKIIDFGVSLETRSLDPQTEYSSLGYSAPEIVEQGQADFRADLYSLGALWYALLTGEPPNFMYGAEELIRLTLEDVLQSQSRVPSPVGDLITRLLAADAAVRFQSAQELIEAINQVMGSSYALETRETAASYALRGRFVGRETEQAKLRTFWEQSRQKEGRIVLIGGESGIGKTRLMEEFAVQAELEGAWLARGQCVEHEGMAYRPWREILRILVRCIEATNIETLQSIGPVLAALLPELWHKEYLQGLAPPAELAPQATQQRLNDAINQVLRMAAQARPTLVVIEDAHWADEATLELLRFLSRVSGPTGLLVCVSYRTDEIAPEHVMAVLTGERIERVVLPSLLPEAISELVHSMLGVEKTPKELIQRVQEATGGNTFFMQELIRSLAEDGVVLQRTLSGWQVNRAALQMVRLPHTIRQVVQRRLEHLSGHARQVLDWAAVMGLTFWDSALEELGRVPKTNLRVWLDEGKEKALWTECATSSFRNEREYRFLNAISRDVGYENIPAGQRREAHDRAATWLLGRGEEEKQEHLGLIADHLERAGQAGLAVGYLARAAEQAAAQFANVEAVVYYSRALNLMAEEDWSGKYRFLLAREKVHHLQGNRQAQEQDLAALVDLAEKIGDDRLRTEIALQQAHFAEVTGHYAAAIAADQKAIELARNAKDVPQEMAGYLHWGWSLWSQGELEVAGRQLDQALVLARVAGAREAEAESLLNLGAVFNLQGKNDESRACYEQVLAITQTTGHRRQQGDALNRIGIICLDQNNYAQANIYFEQAWRIFSAIGFRRGESVTLGNLGLILTQLGDFAKAKLCLEQAIEIDREIGHRRGECLIRSSLSLLALYQGDDRAALEYGRQSLAIARETNDRRAQGYVLTNLGQALIHQERLAEAAGAYQEALCLRREMGQEQLVIEDLAGLARIALVQRKLPQALEAVEEILHYLAGHVIAGPYEPQRVYWTCYQVLLALQDPRSRTVLKDAYGLLQEQAGQIADEQTRRSFIEHIAVRQEIVNEYSKSRPMLDQRAESAEAGSQNKTT